MTPNPAITISRSLGSGGTEIGFLAARQLGWHFCDRRILRVTAEALGCTASGLAHREDHPSGYLDQLMAVLAIGSPEGVFTSNLEMPIYSKDLFEVERRVILKMMDHAPSVIVGRGGFIALKDWPAALHVSIHADLESRVRSLVERGKAPDAAAARRLIDASDRSRSAFIRDVSGFAWRDPGHFHLVLDPSRDGLHTCVESILNEARQRFSATTRP